MLLLCTNAVFFSTLLFVDVSPVGDSGVNRIRVRFHPLVVQGLDVSGGSVVNAANLVVNDRIVDFLVVSVMMFSAVSVDMRGFLVVHAVIPVVLVVGVVVMIGLVMLGVMHPVIAVVGVVFVMLHVRLFDVVMDDFLVTMNDDGFFVVVDYHRRLRADFFMVVVDDDRGGGGFIAIGLVDGSVSGLDVSPGFVMIRLRTVVRFPSVRERLPAVVTSQPSVTAAVTGRRVAVSAVAAVVASRRGLRDHHKGQGHQ